MLTFKRKFWDAVLRGEKTQTLRIWKVLRLRADRKVYAPGIGFLWIDSVEEVTFDQLTDEDAVPDGFSSIEALRAEILNIYGPVPVGKLSRVRFHLLPPASKDRIDPLDPLGPEPVFYDTLEAIGTPNRQTRSFPVETAVETSAAETSAAETSAMVFLNSVEKEGIEKGCVDEEERQDGRTQAPRKMSVCTSETLSETLSETPKKKRKKKKRLPSSSKLSASKSVPESEDAVPQDDSGPALWNSWGFWTHGTASHCGTETSSGPKNDECTSQNSEHTNAAPRPSAAEKELKSALEFADRTKCRLEPELVPPQIISSNNSFCQPKELDRERKEMRKDLNTVTQDDVDSDPELVQPQKRNAEPMLTESEIVEKMVRKCRIHRNVCDWNHEPGKSQDFFSLFLQAPRDERGIPILNGFRLRTLMREKVSDQEWDEICWIAAEICEAWNEWQYAVEHWFFPRKIEEK